jgi:hypothetical protein
MCGLNQSVPPNQVFPPVLSGKIITIDSMAVNQSILGSYLTPLTIDAFFLATAGITSHVSVNSLTYSLPYPLVPVKPSYCQIQPKPSEVLERADTTWMDRGRERGGMGNHRLGLLSINQPT